MKSESYSSPPNSLSWWDDATIVGTIQSSNILSRISLESMTTGEYYFFGCRVVHPFGKKVDHYINLRRYGSSPPSFASSARIASFSTTQVEFEWNPPETNGGFAISYWWVALFQIESTGSLHLIKSNTNYPTSPHSFTGLSLATGFEYYVYIYYRNTSDSWSIIRLFYKLEE